MFANLSFSERRFPDVFKFDQVTPVLKKPGADDKDMAKFRPITNLNTISKILECLSQNQIHRHIQGSLNFGPLQSKYCALHSTETAMTRVVNDLLAATDKTPSVLLFLDISAAFYILLIDKGDLHLSVQHYTGLIILSDTVPV